MSNHKIQIRRGSEAQWSSTNPILATGELGVTNTGRIKIGDGTTPWNSLGYITFDGGVLDGGVSPPPPPPLPPPLPPISCPAPWMKIMLSDGKYLAAGELAKGMKVKTRHEDTMEWGEYEVTHLTVSSSDRLKIKIGSVDFVCSPTHKFWDGNGWIAAADLKVGSSLEDQEVFDVSEYEYGDVVKITVEDAHTYICEGVLSHNKTPPLGTTISP